MRIVFDIDLSGIREILDSIPAAHPERLIDSVGDILRGDALEQFQQGGNPRWKPLQAETVRAKQRSGYPRLSRYGRPQSRATQRGNFAPSNILIRTGELLSSWTNKDDPHHEQGFEDGAFFTGSRLPRAAFHQDGRGVPLRPLRVTEKAQARIADLIGSTEAK